MALFSAKPTSTRIEKATAVSSGLSRKSIPRARIAVSTPPANSTNPVPIRFRRPSTSFMIRFTSAPVLLESWKATGKRPT